MPPLFDFALNNIPKLAELLSVISTIDDIIELKFSPDLFSIITDVSTCTDCVLALQMWPHFFRRYSCQEDQFSWIYLRQIYPLMINFLHCGFTSLSFTVEVPHRATLAFQDTRGFVQQSSIELNPSDDSRDLGEYDMHTFVTMDKREFMDLVTRLHMYQYVLVILTNTQVKFSYVGREEIIITRESGLCVIGGVQPEAQVRLLITLHPMQHFLRLAERAVRIWMFKSTNNSKGVIAAVLGLDSRFMMYFPEVINA